MRFPNPERSIYYHPTLNPYGAPPPGAKMVYRDEASNRLEGTSQGILAITSGSTPEPLKGSFHTYITHSHFFLKNLSKKTMKLI